jgi:hypothetical protein
MVGNHIPFDIERVLLVYERQGVSQFCMTMVDQNIRIQYWRNIEEWERRTSSQPSYSSWKRKGWGYWLARKGHHFNGRQGVSNFVWVMVGNHIPFDIERVLLVYERQGVYCFCMVMVDQNIRIRYWRKIEEWDRRTSSQPSYSSWKRKGWDYLLARKGHHLNERQGVSNFVWVMVGDHIPFDIEGVLLVYER